MTSFTKRDLYGGAISVELPENYLDGSNIRQVPSHQELFLSPTSLTSLIIEVDSRLAEADEASATTYFQDPLEPPDTSTIDSTTKISLASSSLSKYPAYLTVGEISSHERQQHGSVIIKCFLLLVRIEDKMTDLCLRLNVPLREFDAAGAAEEELSAKHIMERIISSLEVKDFGLFID